MTVPYRIHVVCGRCGWINDITQSLDQTMIIVSEHSAQHEIGDAMKQLWALEDRPVKLMPARVQKRSRKRTEKEKV